MLLSVSSASPPKKSGCGKDDWLTIDFFVFIFGRMQSLTLLIEACDALMNAKQFQALLSIILTMGNYINGTNYAGGAFGFKITSINRVRV